MPDTPRPVVHSRPVSGGAGARSAPTPLGAPEALPFELGGVVGRGGMGEVRAAWDPRLRRDVAVKTVRPGDPTSASRLAREAQLTARLEHPGIMPVYEAGRGEDGRPWYAMRLFTGRSLAERIAQAPDLEARLRLVRHVLDAAQALAYAHGQGILHRDVKPANVLTGPFGETIVADWGLACTLEEARHGGSPVGTPGYMSPEQQEGGALDVRADVYGLGGVLIEVIAGQAPDLAPDLRGDVRLPAELVTIARKAHHPDPDARYPHAGAFADDLLAWFEGRRVRAHEYSTAELVQRLVQRWRVPLQVGGIGLVAVGLAVTVGWLRTSREHARAEALAVEAAEAREDERTAFAAALRVQAVAAAEDGLGLEAEVLAVNALRRADTPEGRGVLAAVYGRPRWAAERRLELESCRRGFLSQSGARVLCLDGDTALFLDDHGRELGRATGRWRRGVVDRSDAHALMVDEGQRLWVWTPPRAPVALDRHASTGGPMAQPGRPGFATVFGADQEHLVDLVNQTAVTESSCPKARPVHAMAVLEDGGTLIGCRDGSVRVRRGEQVTELLRVPESQGLPFLVQGLDAGRMFVGTTDGWARVVSATGETIAERELGEESVYSVSVSGDRALVGLTGGDVVVWDFGADVVPLRMRHRGLGVAWLGPERFRVAGRGLEDRAAPASPWPHRLPAEGGVTSLAWAPESRALAATVGAGIARVLDVARGARLGDLLHADGVVKDVAFAPDGSALVVVSASPVQGVYAWPSLVETRRVDFMSSRRVGWFRTAGILLAPYKRESWALPAEGPPVKVDVPGFQDLEVNLDGSTAAALDDINGVWRGVDGVSTTWTRLAEVKDSTGIAIAGANVLVSDAQTLRRLHPDGEVTWEVAVPSNVTDLAASPDGRWAAVGTLDGAILVWAVGETTPRARVAAHRARVSALSFSPDNRWLASGAWDADVRIWSLEALEVPSEPLVDEVETALGLHLDEVLAPIVGSEGR